MDTESSNCIQSLKNAMSFEIECLYWCQGQMFTYFWRYSVTFWTHCIYSTELGYKDSDWCCKENYDRRKMTRSLHVWQRYLKCLLLYGSTILVVIWHRLHLALVTIRSPHQSRSDNLTHPLSCAYIKLSIKAKCFQTDLPASSLNLTPHFTYT